MADIKQLLDGVEKRAVFHKPGVTAEDSRADVPKLVAALRAVLDLHKMLLRPAWTGDPDDWCSQCDGQAYPCETVRAITEALEKSDG